MRKRLVGIFALVAVLCIACLQTPARSAPAAEPTPNIEATVQAAVSAALAVPTITSTPSPEPAATQTLTPQPTATPTPESTATLTPTPEPAATPSPLTAAQIFAGVSPSVVFIETSAFTGSGVLIEGGYVVTNAHVVWPFREVRVVFPDGSEFLDAPVSYLDMMGDLAVIGPLDTDVRPLTLVDGEGAEIGSDVFLIGYPGEAERFPQPTISRGILSRLREWEEIGITYFQTDAAIAGGQSGGVLVSANGGVIGISGFIFTEAGFALVASAADVLPRVRRLIAGEDVAGLGDRRVPLEGGQFEFDVTFRNQWDDSTFVINEPAGTTIDISMDGENDGFFFVTDVYGIAPISVDEGVTGVESGSGTTDVDAPYFLRVGQFSISQADFAVTGNRDLIPYNDVDDGVVLKVGEKIFGNVDHPWDLDYFVISLAAGETVVITVDSANIDPFIQVDFPQATEEQVLWDDDSGGGLFGTNARLTYKALYGGEHLIVVEDSLGTQFGGYILTVEQASPGAAFVSPPSAPTRTTIDSLFGTMALYESAQYPFSMQYPADWMEDPSDPGTFHSATGEVFGAGEEALQAAGLGQITLEEYVDFFVSVMSAVLKDFEVVSREQTATDQGLSIELLQATAFAGVVKLSILVYLHEERIAFTGVYTAITSRHKELAPMIDYSFGTFTVSGE